MSASCPFFGGLKARSGSIGALALLTISCAVFLVSCFKTPSKEESWCDAEELLHVIRTDKLDNPIFAQLKVDIDKKLVAGVNDTKINHADFTDSERLAAGITAST